MKKQAVFRTVFCILSLLSALSMPILAHAVDEKVIYLPSNTQRVCQLTPDRSVGIEGTDLGFSFEHRAKSSLFADEQRTIFLFGDTVGKLPINLDSMAYT